MLEITKTRNQGLWPQGFKSRAPVLKSVGQDSTGKVGDRQENYSGDEKWT